MESAWEELTTEAIEAIRSYLRDPTGSKEAITAVRAASSALGSAARHEQAIGAREALLFMMVREVANNPEELGWLLRKAIPESAVTKAIETKAITTQVDGVHS